MLFFSQRTRGFYDDALHEKLAIPEDAVEITPDVHRALIEGQALGHSITADTAGRPILSLIDLDARSKAKIKHEALGLLQQTDVLALRFLERGRVPAELLVYREALREVVRGNETTLPPVPDLPSPSV